MFYNNEWGTVCDDNWDLMDAAVVCRQLGCGVALSAPSLAQFGWGVGPIWLDDVSCTGQETDFFECRAKMWGIHNCHHGEDAGVVCAGESRDGRAPAGTQGQAAGLLQRRCCAQGWCRSFLQLSSMRISWTFTSRPSARSCTWVGATAGISTGWGMKGSRAAV